MRDAGRQLDARAAASRIASTAVPSDTPGAVSKPRVVAGILRHVGDLQRRGAAPRCWRRPTAASAVAGAGAQLQLPSDGRRRHAASGRASRITRYWLVSVKMVETMRWPKALYSASSIAGGGDATGARRCRGRCRRRPPAPVAPASVTTLRTCGSLPQPLAPACAAHSSTVALSAPSSETRYCVGPALGVDGQVLRRLQVQRDAGHLRPRGCAAGPSSPPGCRCARASG